MNNSVYSNTEERLTITISEAEKEQLRKYAKKKKLTMSMAVRLILSEFFASDLLKSQVSSKDDAA